MSPSTKLQTALLIVLLFLFIACNSSSETHTAAAQHNRDTLPAEALSIPGNFSSQTEHSFDSTQIQPFLDSFKAFQVFAEDIHHFYQKRDFAYAWFDEHGLIEPAENLHNNVINISEEGLPDKVLYKEQFGELMLAAHDKRSVEAELMLTCQYLDYAKQVWKGISEKEFGEVEWLLPRKKINYSQLLDSLTGKNTMKNEPVYKQYHLLKAQLKKLTEISARNSLPQIKTDKKKLAQGDSATVIGDIRHWLTVMGDMAENNGSAVFDQPLADGVKRLQNRLGLKEDGVIGSAVLEAMNYPITKRIEAIMVNMERCRWIPVDLQKDYLLVNIPEYKLHVIENDSFVINMNVVVGKSQHKTVVFNGDLKYVVFSPYWNVPTSILKNEILPGIKRNPNYLAQHNMEWHGNGVRQKPGPNNSLGLVKFLFPNSHSIYLHDSPAKSLFNETNRAFSHGCIRVSEPKKLAAYLLRNDKKWDDASITAAMKKGVEQTVTLEKTLPVFIAYFTAWVDRQGKLNFRKDVYDRDGRLAKLIFSEPTI